MPKYFLLCSVPPDNFHNVRKPCSVFVRAIVKKSMTHIMPLPNVLNLGVVLAVDSFREYVAKGYIRPA